MSDPTNLNQPMCQDWSLSSKIKMVCLSPGWPPQALLYVESGSISTSDCFYFKFFCVSIFLVFLLGACGAAQPGQCMGRLMSLIIAHEQEQSHDFGFVLHCSCVVDVKWHGIEPQVEWVQLAWCDTLRHCLIEFSFIKIVSDSLIALLFACSHWLLESWEEEEEWVLRRLVNTSLACGHKQKREHCIAVILQHGI